MTFKTPDWKDERAYPEPGKASNACFAWEFLRRNPAYQAAWVDFIKDVWSGRHRRTAVWLDPANRMNIPEAEWRWRYDQRHRRFASLSAEFLGNAWGLERLVSPQRDYGGPRGAWFKSRPACEIVGETELRNLANGVGNIPSTVILRVDLEAPFEVTAAAVKSAIEGERRYRVKAGTIVPVTERSIDPEMWRNYLRVLDARQSGATLSQIAIAINPNKWPTAGEAHAFEERVKKWPAVAEQLLNGGYRALLMLKERGIPEEGWGPHKLVPSIRYEPQPGAFNHLPAVGKMFEFNGQVFEIVKNRYGLTEIVERKGTASGRRGK